MFKTFRYMLLCSITLVGIIGVSFAQQSTFVIEQNRPAINSQYTKYDERIKTAASKFKMNGESSVFAITNRILFLKKNLKNKPTNPTVNYIIDGLLYYLHKDFFDNNYTNIGNIESNFDYEYVKRLFPGSRYNGYNSYREQGNESVALFLNISWFIYPEVPNIIKDAIGTIDYTISDYYINIGINSASNGSDFSLDTLNNYIRQNFDLLTNSLNTVKNIGSYSIGSNPLVPIGSFDVPSIATPYTFWFNNNIRLELYYSPDIKKYIPITHNPSASKSIGENYNTYKIVGNKKYSINPRGGIQQLNRAMSQKLLDQRFLCSDCEKLGYEGQSIYEKSVKNISDDMLPVFGVYPIDEDYSILFLYPPYDTPAADGLGKPVIYSYDHLNRPNTVTIKLPKDGVFTYLKPLFNIDQGRSYQSRDGKVVVDGSTYDYLRYKAAVNNYQINDRGRIVKGSEIADFYDQKLDQIGFNKKEKADFVEYRVPKYASDKQYFVSFKFNEQLDPYAKLQFSLQPDALSRVLMETVELSDKNKSLYMSRKIDSNDLSHIQSIKRTGKHDIVERGGVFRAPNNQWVFGEIE